uniref:Uncharacterized protein n=1 Tax=Rhizophora mucronata TaxID=61149 RepID=A0A2P2QMY2_RHIMU
MLVTVLPCFSKSMENLSSCAQKNRHECRLC